MKVRKRKSSGEGEKGKRNENAKAFGKSRLYGVVFTVIGVQIHLFDLGDERITGICARALVIESVLAHFIERGEKFFLRSFLPDRFANGGGLTDSALKVLYLFDQSFYEFVVRLAFTAEVSGYVRVSGLTFGIGVLRKVPILRGASALLKRMTSSRSREFAIPCGRCQ